MCAGSPRIDLGESLGLHATSLPCSCSSASVFRRPRYRPCATRRTTSAWRYLQPHLARLSPQPRGAVHARSTSKMSEALSDAPQSLTEAIGTRLWRFGAAIDACTAGDTNDQRPDAGVITINSVSGGREGAGEARRLSRGRLIQQRLRQCIRAAIRMRVRVVRHSGAPVEDTQISLCFTSEVCLWMGSAMCAALGRGVDPRSRARADPAPQGSSATLLPSRSNENQNQQLGAVNARDASSGHITCVNAPGPDVWAHCPYWLPGPATGSSHIRGPRSELALKSDAISLPQAGDLCCTLVDRPGSIRLPNLLFPFDRHL